MKNFYFTGLFLLFTICGFSTIVPPTITLGNYTNTSITTAGGNTTVTPDAAPTGGASVTAHTTTDFKGLLTVNSISGVVTITNAHPAGSYIVTVDAGFGFTKTFTLTVGNALCGLGFYAPATLDYDYNSELPYSVAIGDFNGDGKQDFATANIKYSNVNSPGTVSIRLGNGLGGFGGITNVAVGTQPYSVAIGDFNGDGFQDLATANYTASGTVSIRLGNGLGGFSGITEAAVGTNPTSIAIGDFNGDGKLDFAVANKLSNSVSIRLGNGQGGFSGTTEIAVGTNPRSIAIGDFNGDGASDFATANETYPGSVSIRLGDGLGGFSGTTNVGVGLYPTSLAIGDFNGDGAPDFAASTGNIAQGGSVSIRLGDGLGGFSGTTNIVVGESANTLAIGDFNGDGKQDFVTTDVYTNSMSIGLGNGLGGFSGITQVDGGLPANTLAIGDLNSDGKQDIFSQYGLRVCILLGGNPSIHLKGNSEAIASGDTSPSVADNTDFGSGGNTNTRTFTIQCEGPTPITIRSIGISGADASKFSINGIALPITIAAGTEVTFNIVSIDFSAALKIATVNINTNNCDVVPYTFAIQAGSILPTMGVYSNVTIANAGGNTLVSPTVIPLATNFTAYTTAKFKGTVAVNTTTGVVSITNAHPAGNYTVIIKDGQGILYNLTLTVGNTHCSQGQFYAPAMPEVAVGTNPNSVAIGDFNGDGKQDMAIANYGSSSVSIRLGDGLGGFSGTTDVAVESSPYSVAIGDFNGDSKQDFASSNLNGTVSIRMGDGLGGFSGGAEVNVGDVESYVALGDFNGDGKQDFASASINGRVFIRLGDGLGGFSGFSETSESSLGYSFRSILISDFNNDGKQDIAAVTVDGVIFIRLGDGSGGFSAASNLYSGYNGFLYANSVATGDFNSDGKQDLVICNPNASTNSTSFKIFLGNGLGGFTPGPAGMATGGSSTNVAVGDFNGDGKQDIATTVSSGNVIIYRGDNTGLFNAINPGITVGTNPSSIAIGDFDGDGTQDVVTTNFDAGSISIRLASLNQAEINLNGNGQNIVSAAVTPSVTDGTDFGAVVVNTPATKTFIIQNTGTGPLTIHSIKISGTGVAFFTTSGITFPAIIAAGSETTFNINCYLTLLGTKTATITINNDDCDEGVYTFNVQATNLPITLGSYAVTAIPTAGGNSIITPSAAPTGNAKLTATTSVDFKGKLTVDAATGVVRITNANPAGTYQITVNTGLGLSQTFTLTVGKTLCSQGQFLSPTSLNIGANPGTTEVADFNNDGYQDFAVTLGNPNNAVSVSNPKDGISIELGNGSGGFTTGTTLPFVEPISYLTINDFNGDGNADMVVKGRYNLFVCLGNGLGGFTSGATIPLIYTINYNTTAIIGTTLLSILSEDLDQDGIIDLVATGSGGFAVFKGNGQGGFSLLNTYSNGIFLNYIEKGDFNGDGFTDLSMGSPFLGDNCVYLGDGNGGFGDAAIYNLSTAIRFSTVGDFDGDGKSDLLSALGNTPGTVAFRKNNGDGTFAAPTYIAVGDNPFQVVSGDLNGDGKLDFATGNNSLKTVSVRYGNGDGTFYGATELQSNALATGLRLIVGDFNTDGIQDIGTSNGSITTDNFSVFLGASKEINLQGNGQNIVSGDSTPSVADATDFGAALLNTPTAKTYTIQNTGTSNLSVSTIALSGVNAASFVVSGITLPATIAAGATTTFTVTFNAVASGVKTATVTITSDDCDESAYTFAVQGIGCSEPITDFVSPLNGTAGTNITIYGIQFGSSPSVTIGGVAMTVISAAETSIVATLPAGICGGAIVVANSCGTSSNYLPTYSYAEPITDYVFPLNGTAGTNITIYGIQFGSSPTVTIGGVSMTVISATETTIVATLPIVSCGGNIVVTNSCGAVSNSLSYTYTTLTWTGAISTSWNTAGNWSCGVVPTSISDVTIAAASNQPVLSANLIIHTLTLEAGTTMTVPSGLNLTVSNYIHNAGTLTVANNANLIQVDAVANTGNVVVYRDSAPIVRLDHTLWSSPVDSQNLFTFSPATLTNRFYTYDTSSNTYTNVGLNANSTFISGKGFAVRAPNDQTAVAPTAWQGTFTGVPNNGTIPFTLNATTGYNLVGNPYPSTIDAATFIAANPNIVGTLYFYAHSLPMNTDGSFPVGTNYATWNSLGSTEATRIPGDVHLVPVSPSGIIQLGQGFFVKSNTSGTINFTNAMRVADNSNQTFRTAAVEKDRLWLNLRTDTGTDINQILVGYITGATLDVDRNYDGLSFGNTGSYISSKIIGDDYAIQGRSLPFDSSDIVPLGFKADTAGNYTIALTNSDGVFAGNQEVFLQDDHTGITHNIKGSSYSFTSQTGTFDTRFSLVYGKTLGVDANSLSPNSVQVYKESEWFRVKTNGITMQEVSVYDLAGRLIFKKSDINDTTTLLKGLSQVQETMLIKIVSQENQTVTVKVIN